MAERKATNKYYPPDWDPSKGSINKHVGQHPLRERARKLDQGILIIRFELPFNVWCEGCGRHIARGVRFNAEKKKIGAYFSTPLWSFRMKCPSCTQWIEIHTDPAAADYTVVSGAQRKCETWRAEDNETTALKGLSVEDAKRKAENPFFRLEHEAEDVKRAKATLPRLESIKAATDGVFQDDWSASQRVRRQFRQNKKIHEQQTAAADVLRRRGNFDLKLQPEHPDDIRLAKQTGFSAETKGLRDRRLEVLGESPFSHKQAKPVPSSGIIMDAEDILKEERSCDSSLLNALQLKSAKKMNKRLPPEGPKKGLG